MDIGALVVVIFGALFATIGWIFTFEHIVIVLLFCILIAIGNKGDQITQAISEIRDR